MTNPPNNLEQEKKLFKDNIELLISSGDIENSKKLIMEYEAIEKYDVDILNMKAIIFIIENKLDDAEYLLWEGIKLDPENKDVLFNLAYLYETKGEIQKAINFYWLVYKKTNDFNQRNETRNTLLRLKLIENTSEKKFIILSSCPWSVMLQRPHQIARALSKLGHMVEYVQPTIQATSSDAAVGIEDLMELSHYHTRAIELINIHTPVLVNYDDKYILNNYKEIVQELIDDSDEEVIILCYFPSQVNTINQLTGNFRVVYECVDDHSDLDYSYWSDKHDREYEALLLSRADIVTTTSSALYLSKSMYQDNVFLSKNAVNIEDFNENRSNGIPDDLTNIPGPKICYVGAVDRWFDEELFYRLVRENKDKSFIVIGPIKDGILSIKEDNLFILGVKEHSQLSTYLSCMDVGIIPFKDDIDIIVNCDPIKMYEYVMSGLPVVATNMPELALNKKFIKTCKDTSEFNKALEDAIKCRPSNQEITDFINENTWQARVKQIVDILNGKVENYSKSIVIERLKLDWEQSLKSRNNPILLSMYSLIVKASDELKSLEFAEHAYVEMPISYTLKNYINSLVNSKDINKAIQVVLNDGYVDERYKAELVYAIKNNLNIDLKLMYCIKNFDQVRRLMLLRDEEKKSIEYANYFFEIGELTEAFYIYSSLSQRSYIVHDSPIASYNFAELLKINNINRSSYFEERYHLTAKKYLNCSSNEVENLMISNDITILILTRNRPFLLDRCLSYFESINNERLNVRLHVLDASEEKEKKILNGLLEKYDSKKIMYSHFDRNSSFAERITHIIPTITDQYCAICADDDFLGEEGIISSINILSSYKDVVTVKGRSFIYKENNVSDIYDFPMDACERLIESNPIERLQRLVRNWVPQLMYLVFRKETLQKLTTILVEQNVDQKLPPIFVEYLWYFHIPLLGKVENVDAHLTFRDFSMSSEGHTAAGFSNYIEDGTFNDHYQVFKTVLISSYEGSPEVRDDLLRYIDEIMSLFLINSWNVKKEFVQVVDGNFNVEMLKQGIH